MNLHSYTRRRLVAGTAAAIALGPLRAHAQSKNIRVVIPTGQGGGAERLARSFDEVWSKLLKTNFEYSFYAGAAGQVGYETFVHKREKDGYNLLFGNMGPEMIMYALQKPNYRFPEDFQYFCRTDIDDSVVFALRKGKFQRVEDLVAEAK
jgi:tripartite-type tricarboxylate transporter receptor subunit TctC